MKKKILIADDHQVVRDGIKLKLKRLFPGMEIEEADDMEAVRTKTRETEYDMLLLDLGMPNTSPISLMTEITRKYPDTPTLIFSMYPSNIFALRALEMGIKGYVNKKDSMDQLGAAVEKVLEGKRYFDQSVSELMADKLSNRAASGIESLSNRELEIMILLVNGMNPKEISEELFIHSSTIGTHRHRIFTKLNVKNLVELAQYASKLELL